MRELFLVLGYVCSYLGFLGFCVVSLFASFGFFGMSFHVRGFGLGYMVWSFLFAYFALRLWYRGYFDKGHVYMRERFFIMEARWRDIVE